MTTKLLLVIACLASACSVALVSPVSAQDICASPDVTQGQVTSGAPHKLRFCSPQTDQIEGVTVYRNGQKLSSGAVSPLAAPNAAGMVAYEVLIGQVPKGSYTYELATYNTPEPGAPIQEGARGGPFVLLVVDPKPVPSAPRLKGIVR